MDEDPSGAPYAAGELIVTYEEDTGAGAPPVRRLLQSVEGTVEETLPSVDSQLLDFPEVKQEGSQSSRENLLEEKKQELERAPEVSSADYNYLREHLAPPNDPLFDRQWYLNKAAAPVAWNETMGDGASIAVIDSGIDTDHPDLQSKIAAQANCAAEGEDLCADGGNVEDSSGHGTHVAGIAAAAANNDRGVAGTCPNCDLLIARTSNEAGEVFVSSVVKAIDWASGQNADVINISLGGPGSTEAEELAVDNAQSAGVIVVAAAGNANTNSRSYPAGYESVVAVSATTRQDTKARYSNFGSWIDVAAPGGDATRAGGVFSTVPGGYGVKSGTSMSSPVVAGVAGLLASQGRGNIRIEERLKSSTVDFGPSGRDNIFGHGRVDAAAAVGARPRNTHPRVSNLYPKPGARFRANSVTIRATVGDGQTELKKQNITLFVDGRRAANFRYNAANDRLTRLIKLSPGRHSVRIVVGDGWGLGKSQSWRFSSVRAPG